MNPRIRALIWEECRTGRVIALWCLICGGGLSVLGVLSLLTEFSVGLHDTYEMVLLVTVCTPLAVCLLVTLNPANTGHLRGGFPERVLRLPVTTAMAVAVALVSRTVMVLLVGAVVTALCHYSFDQGPGARMVALIGEVYLIIQTLDWLRRPAPLLSFGCGIAMFAGLFGYAATMRRWPWLDLLDGKYPASLVLLAPSLLVVYAISLSVVRATRCGEPTGPSFPASLEGISLFAGRRARKPFRSPIAARVWFETRRNGAYLPMMILLNWLLMVLAVWLVTTLHPPSEKASSFALSSAWYFDIIPYAAVVLTFLAWAPLFLGMTRKSRTSMFPFLQPISTATMVRARLIAAGVCLGAVLVIVAVLSNVLFLLGYPIDLTDIPATPLPHLAKLRHLARILCVETVIASAEKQPTVAADAILAILPIAYSFDGEPFVVSQLVRIAILDIAVRSLETAMNRASFPAEDLERLQEGFANALLPANELLIMDRAMVGEVQCSLSTQYDLYLYTFWQEGIKGKDKDKYERYCLLFPVWDVLNMGTFERIVTIRYVSRMMEQAHAYDQAGVVEIPRPLRGREQPPVPVSLFWRAPVASLTLPALGRAYDAEWRIRMGLALAQTALAVERFRLVHGTLPKQLDALVPGFLESVPRDSWNDGRLVSYRIKDNGEFVVYSFALNGRDDGGEEDSPKHAWFEGDLTFTVAPPEVRDRPQVALAGQ